MIELTTSDPVRLVQITDSHLYSKSSGTLLKMNTQDSLDHVVNMIKQEEAGLDLILATGDISQDASVTAYKNFIAAMQSLDTPFRWIPGNHDRANVMADVATDCGASEKMATINNWRILLLDTSIDGQVHGNLAEAELEFLKQQLQTVEENESIDHCLVTLHHNPVPGNSGWMKDIGLRNAEEFFELVNSCSKVRCVVYAHIHQELDFELDGIRYFCSPSTCIQFKPNVNNFALDRLNPGYRTFELFADGSIQSEVHRVEGFTFEADFSSEGY